MLLLITSAPAWSDQIAATPPMGWNSYDAFSDSVTEAEVLANARYMKAHLAAHGWQYIVVDFRWYDPKPTGDDARLNKDRLNATLSMDPYGRLTPAPNRFPSSANGKGFKPLADQLHAMGLKFGIHVMRGIPRMAVKGNLPIEGSNETAWDATSFSLCDWCPDMFGVNASSPAGQAYYDSIFRLYAQWGVDFVKVDDLSMPYSTAEVSAIRRSIDRSGRKMVFSTSPGPTPVRMAGHVSRYANMWRISGDFWDRWTSLNAQFDLLASWNGWGGPGHWPDADMIPFGHLCIRSKLGGPDHWTHFTPDEQLTLMSLWALAPSPLMIDANLPDDDAWTDSLLTNDDVIAIDQDRAGKQAARISHALGTEIWVKPLANGDHAVGLFNRTAQLTDVTFVYSQANLTSKQMVHDAWARRDMGEFDDQIGMSVPPHGAVLLRLTAMP
jgi:alpha-galactosidase